MEPMVLEGGRCQSGLEAEGMVGDLYVLSIFYYIFRISYDD
jgi:hypothetical protein